MTFSACKDPPTSSSCHRGGPLPAPVPSALRPNEALLCHSLILLRSGPIRISRRVIAIRAGSRNRALVPTGFASPHAKFPHHAGIGQHHTGMSLHTHSSLAQPPTKSQQTLKTIAIRTQPLTIVTFIFFPTVAVTTESPSPTFTKVSCCSPSSYKFSSLSLFPAFLPHPSDTNQADHLIHFNLSHPKVYAVLS